MNELTDYLHRYLGKLHLELAKPSNDRAFDTDQLKMLLILVEESEKYSSILANNAPDQILKDILDKRVKENLEVLKNFEKELGV